MSDTLQQQLQAALGSAYTIERELGGGGMSRVFVTRDVALDRKVVAKIIAPELAEGVSVDRFAREVRLAASLQQANIVPVITAGSAAGLPYYTMPFVDGLSLRSRLENGAVPLVDAINILRDVARALAYAHANGVVHRDIKPENILLSGGTAVVTDFGIAKALFASRTAGETTATGTGFGLTRAGMSLGTPAYMSPEQALGDALTDQRTDLYAWGVVAWEMIAGAHPFAARTTAHAMISAHVSDSVPALDMRVPGVPRSLGVLIARCLEKDPAKRPASANELMALLNAVATPSPVRAGAMQTTWARSFAIGAVVIAIIFTVVMVRRAPATTSVAAAVTGAAVKSLAVLPFVSVGGDTANAYFAEGIADELTTALARLPELRLAGRSSAARFGGRDASAQDIGAALKVGAVLDGTVRRSGNQVRVSVELTNAEDGKLIWKQSYPTELKDVFAMQDELTRAIVSALQVQLVGTQRTGTTLASTKTNPAAYDLYLRGMQLYRKRGKNLPQSERYLMQAIALDSTFSKAYAMLATVLMVEPYFSDVSMPALIPRAEAAAKRAIALDSASPDAHMALGLVYNEAFNWKDSETELRRAVALEPNSAEILFRLGFMLVSCGRVDEALPVFERIKVADPLYPVPAALGGLSLLFSGRREEGIAEVRRAFDLDSTNMVVDLIFAASLSKAGLTHEAAVFGRKMVALTQNDPRRVSFFGLVLAAESPAELRPILANVLALPNTVLGRNVSLMYLYLGVNDTTKALAYLDSASRLGGDIRGGELILLSQAISTQKFDPLRRSARFAESMQRYSIDVSKLPTATSGVAKQ